VQDAVAVHACFITLRTDPEDTHGRVHARPIARRPHAHACIDARCSLHRGARIISANFAEARERLTKSEDDSESPIPGFHRAHFPDTRDDCAEKNLEIIPRR
jgi:hypothetical protein